MNLEKLIEEKKREAYNECQEASGLKIGDKVRVTRKAKSNELGWANAWVDEMDNSVGQVCTIEVICSGNGIRLSSGNVEYPYFVLKKIKPIKKTKPEFLSHGEWTKTMCSDEQIADFKKFGSDKDYIYATYTDLLYRTKRDK